MIDLDSVDPKGRLDVLIYKGLGMLVETLEQQQQVSGIWDNIKPHVGNVIASQMQGVEIPTEVRVLLGILQSNMKPKEIEK